MNNEYTVIDSDRYGEAHIETMFFPGGEPHVKLPKMLPHPILLFLKLRTWNDVGIAACLMDALERRGAHFKAFIPYFPGARQDRTNGLAPLTLDLVFGLLTSRSAQTWSFSAYEVSREIWVFDPHSNVLADRIGKDRILMPSDLVTSNIFPKYDGVIAPDDGARDRAKDFASLLMRDADDIVTLDVCKKTRDPITGRITSYQTPRILGDGNPEGHHIVVDDICDGGATFNLLADSIHASHPDVTLDLWVSHGIFSKGIDAIHPKYQRIYTTDSWAKIGVSEGGNIPNDGYTRARLVPLNGLFDKIMGV